MESTLLAYRENAGKREIGVLICGFRGSKFDEEEDDEETIFFSPISLKLRECVVWDPYSFPGWVPQSPAAAKK